MNQYTASRTFVNISKPNGGVFDPGDTIEVRYTILVPQSPQPVGGAGAPQTRYILKSAQIIDTLPTNVTYVTGSLRIRTNEGMLYKGPFTEAVDPDQGNYTTAGVNNIVSIRARPFTGPTTDTLSGGTWRNTGSWVYQNNASIPRFSNNSFGMITYRVRVNAAYGQFLTFNKSTLWFRGVADAASQPKYRFQRNVIAVFQSPGLCSNGLALSNVFETNGSFGSAKPRNRALASPIVPTGPLGYTFIPTANGNPNDGYYSIVNNSSDSGSNNTSSNGTFALRKIFDVFDVIGDHTNAANQLTGNLPVDTAVARPGGGYMLLVNASYLTNAAVTQTINNVCKNTYYEFSAWFRNICPRCAADSIGNGSTTWAAGWPPNPAYISYAGNDSAGVRPNLAFEINDTTYYTSGDLPYDKTQLNAWKKRGFLFLNNLDSFRITIRNNSPGGGGNDWVMDDVSVSACVPTLRMNYTPYVLGCSDVGPVFVGLTDTVRYSYNGSYVYYKWQRSINGGGTWTDIAGTTGGPAVPTLVGGLWQYTTNYSFLANGLTDSGYRYRVVVATTLANLGSGTCAFTDGSYTYLRFIKCIGILFADLTSFNGSLVNERARLTWNVNRENDLDHYELEKSNDGIHFLKLGDIPATGSLQYNYTDVDPLNGIAYYRLKLISRQRLYNYSRMVMLSSRELEFELKNVSNPFNNIVTLQYVLPQAGEATLLLLNGTGRIVMTRSLSGSKGLNEEKLPVSQSLPNGLYTLRLISRDWSAARRIIKSN